MIAHNGRVGVIGASSLIGDCLIPLLVEAGYDVVAFSRQAFLVQHQQERRGVVWRFLPARNSNDVQHLPKWVCLAPIWVLPEYFSMLSIYGIKHIVAISSTSRFTKSDSADINEKNLAKRLSDSEECLLLWAKKNDVTWTILRPTLTYGLGHDKNISVIARFIQRFSFFPLFGAANGLRQPLHVCDLALSCLAALNSEASINKSYNISGGETLPYREMVERVFRVLGRKPRLVKFPIWIFRLAVMFLRILPRFSQWSVEMAGRMNVDLVYDHTDARIDLDFITRSFDLKREDLPD